MTACESATVEDLAPSGKLVYKILEYSDRPLTQKQIIEETLMSPRTVRDALNELESMGVVEKDVYLPDARQNLYRLRSMQSITSEDVQ